MLRSGFYAVCLMLVPIQLYAQGPLLWEVQQDIDGGLDFTRAITFSGKSAVVVGNAGVPVEGSFESDFFIEALSRTGAVRWSDQTFLSNCCVSPLFLTTKQKRAYAVGSLSDGDPLGAFLVRAYDVPSGRLLWQNAWRGEQGLVNWNPTGIAASPTHVVAIGYADNATRDGLAAVVRAFDSLTGAILWEDRVGATGVDIIPWAIAVNQNRVFVAGSSAAVGIGADRDLFVRAYDAVSGDVAWETGRQGVSVTTIRLDSGRLLIGGSAGSNTYLAAISTKNGAFFWQDATPMPGFVIDIAANGPRIAAAIVGRESAVRVYDLTTGNVKWEDRPTIPPGFRESFLTVGLNQNAVYVAGSVGQDFGIGEFLVRAYDASTGLLLWDDRSHPSTATTTAVDLAVNNNRLFVAGTTNSDLLIRAYDARMDITATH